MTCALTARTVLIFALVGLCMPGAVSPQTTGDSWSDQYSQLGTSVRGRGLGGAYVSLVDEPLAVLTNPAGIMRCDGAALSGVLDMPGSSTVRVTSALVAPRSGWFGDFWGKYAGFGLGWTHYHSWGIDSSTALGRHGLTSSVTSGAFHASMAGEWDFGGQVNVSAGVTWKTYYREMGRIATANGVDWGLQIQPLKFWHDTPKRILLPLRLGFVHENAYRPQFTTATGEEMSLRKAARVALSYDQFWLPRLNLQVALAIQGRYMKDSRSIHSFGAEFVKKLGRSSNFAMRIGWDYEHREPTFSIGIRSPLTSSAFGADFLVREKIRQSDGPPRRSGGNSVGLTYTIEPTNTAEALLAKADRAKDTTSKKYYAWQVLSRYLDCDTCQCQAAVMLALEPGSTDTLWYVRELGCKDDSSTVDSSSTDVSEVHNNTTHQDSTKTQQTRPVEDDGPRLIVPQVGTRKGDGGGSAHEAEPEGQRRSDSEAALQRAQPEHSATIALTEPLGWAIGRTSSACHTSFGPARRR